MMIINSAHLLEKDLSGEFLVDPSKFSILRKSTGEGNYRFTAPVTTRFRAMRVKNIIEVEGAVSTVVGLTCGRCLTEFDLPFRTHFTLTYAGKTGNEKQNPDDSPEDDADATMESRMAGMIPFKGPELDLRDGVQEQIMLALPGRPLCRNSCKGLCPVCGIDLNEESCECEQPPAEHPFDVLKGLKL